MALFATALSIWRQDGIGALAAHARLVSLRRLHHIIWDGRFEGLETVPTGGYLMQQHLDPSDNTNLGSAREYLPSPRLVVSWILDGLGEDYSRFTFVDFGSGRGRVLLAAAEKPFSAVRGVEFSGRLHAEAECNIANYPAERLGCRDVRSVCIDAAEYQLPEGDCILYFFNPFSADLIDQVVTRALETAQSRQSRVILVYYNPVHITTMAGHRRLRRRSISLFDRLKLKLLSPYPVMVFELDGFGSR